MIRKALGAAFLLLLVDGVGFGFGGTRWTYDTTRTLFGMGRESVKANMPIGFEIERAKRQLADLRPVIAQHKHRMLEEEAQLAILDRQIAAQEKKLAEDREEIMILKNDLQSEKESFRYGGRVYTVSEVKQDLTRRFERLKTNDATVEKLRQTRDARHRRLEALQDKVAAMEAAVRQMDAEIANLEAQLQLVEAAEAGSMYNLDESPLSRLKELMADLQTRVEVRAKMADREVDAYDEIPVRASDSDNIVDEITRYFEKQPGQLVLSH
jgi:chromosome segregation ATPase